MCVKMSPLCLCLGTLGRQVPRLRSPRSENHPLDSRGPLDVRRNSCLLSCNVRPIAYRKHSREAWGHGEKQMSVCTRKITEQRKTFGLEASGTTRKGTWEKVPWTKSEAPFLALEPLELSHVQFLTALPPTHLYVLLPPGGGADSCKECSRGLSPLGDSRARSAPGSDSVGLQGGHKAPSPSITHPSGRCGQHSVIKHTQVSTVKGVCVLRKGANQTLATPSRQSRSASVGAVPPPCHVGPRVI